MSNIIRWPRELLAIEEHVERPVNGQRVVRAAAEETSVRSLVERPTVSLPAGAIDYPDSGSMVPRSVLPVQGWAMFPGGPPDRVELSLGERYLGRARLFGAREDIKRATGIDAAGVSGFSFDLELWAIEESVQRTVIKALALGPGGESLELAPVDVWLSAPESAPAQPAERQVRRRSVLAQRPKDIELVVATGEHGAQSTLPRLVERLRQLGQGRELGGVVLSTVDDPALAQFEDAGLDVHLSGPFPVHSPSLYEDRLEELQTWVGRQRFDAAFVDFSAFPVGDLAARLGLPTVWSISESIPLRSHWAMLHSETDPQVRRRAEAALKMGAAAVFEADVTRRLFAPDLPGVPCLTLPHGVDIGALQRGQESIDRDEARWRRDIPRGATVVLCTGTFSPPEEQAALVWAFARVADAHPDAVLLLVDSLGPMSAAAAGLAVSACGLGEDRIRVEPLLDDLREVYAIADLFVCAPDWAWQPASILEAMAVGLPVLGTAVLGIPELIEDGVSGWLSEPGDVGALALALDRVLSLGAGEREKVEQAALAMVRSEHDSRACERAWAELLARVAARRTINPSSLMELARRDPE